MYIGVSLLVGFSDCVSIFQETVTDLSVCTIPSALFQHNFNIQLHDEEKKKNVTTDLLRIIETQEVINRGRLM